MAPRRRPPARRIPRPKEGVWSGQPLPVRRTARPVPGVWVPLVWSPILWGLVSAVFALPYPIWLGDVGFVGVGLWILLNLVWRVCEALALRGVDRDRAFSDAPPRVVEYPMEIVLYDAGRYVGADRGFVWFDQGRLIFNGEACSFALMADDFYKRGVIGGRDFYSDVPKDALRLGTYGRTAYVRFLPLVGLRGPRFRAELRDFLRRNEPTAAPRQWPPLASFEKPAESELDALPNASKPTP